MPELPEVTVIVNQLDKKLKGLVLDSIEYDWPKKFFWAAGPEGPSPNRGFSRTGGLPRREGNKWIIKDLKGAKVVGVRRLGKVVVIDLQNAKRLTTKASGVSLSALDVKLSILIHLKLTGQLIYQDAQTRIAGGHPIPPLNLPVPNKTTRVTFTFTNHGKLFFNDLRKFGWVKVVESNDAKIKEAIGAELGPDPLTISYKEFKERLQKRGQSRIKKRLMDQQFIAGIGNIYSDEALWRAKIHPKRSTESLSDSEIKALFGGIQGSLKLAISKGGSSANAYVDSGGERGLYLSFARAYHMTGKPCERCKTPLVREKMDGRSAHFCPNCQRLR